MLPLACSSCSTAKGVGFRAGCMHTTSRAVVAVSTLRMNSRTLAFAGVGLGVGVCALMATGGLSALRRRFFGVPRSEACRPVVGEYHPSPLPVAHGVAVSCLSLCSVRPQRCWQVNPREHAPQRVPPRVRVQRQPHNSRATQRRGGRGAVRLCVCCCATAWLPGCVSHSRRCITISPTSRI